MIPRFELLGGAADRIGHRTGLRQAIGIATGFAVLAVFNIAAADAPGAALPPPRSMEILVIDDVTGKPVPGIGVMSPYNVKPTSNPAEWERSVPRTDPNGKIQISIPSVLTPQGHFFLSIQSSNLPSHTLNWSSPSGSNIRDLLPTTYTVRLDSRTTVGGVVRNVRGQPVAGAKVLVWGYAQNAVGTSPVNGLQFFEQSHLPREMGRAVVTDDTGRWRFDQLPTTLRYVNLDVIHSDGAVASFTTSSPQNYVGVSGTPVDLESLLNTNAVLDLKEGVSMHGIVKDNQGKAVSQAILEEQIGMDTSFTPVSITNRSDGSFELRARSYTRALLRVRAPGFAMALKAIEPKSQSDAIQITLQPEQPVRIQVLTAQGSAVEGASVSAIPHRSGIYAPWQAMTDSKGWATWTNAPLENLIFWVNFTNHPVPRSVRTSLEQREQTVRLPSASNAVTRIRIRAQDEASGKPLARFTVKRRQHPSMQPQSWGEGNEGVFDGEVSLFDLQSGFAEGCLINVEAPGYASWKSEMIYTDAGDQEILARLRATKPIVGQVLTPDGNPAARASVILNLQDWGLYSHEPGVFNVSQGGTTSKCDAEGRYTLAPSAENPWVIISHPSGFASLRLSALEKNSTVSLQPWGRAEGTLMIAGQPAKSTAISVRTPLVREGSAPYQAVYTQTTDATGRFVFTNLPPGSYVCYRQPLPIMGVPIVESHPFPFDLTPGETKKLDLPRSGRLVQGAFQTSEDVNWLNDPHSIQLKLPSAPEQPQWNDFLSPKEFEAARKAYSESPEVRKHQQLARQYQLEMDSAGGFRITDVPPGTYILKVSLTKPPPPGQYRSYNEEPIGTLQKEVIIPPGDGPFDIGVHDITIRSSTTKTSTPVEIALRSLDNKPVYVSALKGKPVVVTLWAEWALGGKEHLLKVDAMRAELKSKEEIAFISVNLDDDENTPKKPAVELDRQWTQTHVQGKERLALIENVGASTLPLTFILDGSGHMAARDVPPDRLKTSLQRAVKKTTTPTP